MKTKLLFISMFWISMTCFSQNTYVPDDNFEQALITLGYDTAPLNNYVPTANINAVTDLTINFEEIYDLTGIEGFTSLTYLNCTINNLSTIDLSQNTLLTTLYCASNNLSTIDLSQNTLLTNMSLNNNNLSAVDVSQNTLLTFLGVSENNLNSLDVSQNTALTELYCNYNNLGTLDVTQNTLLTTLYSDNNNFSTLDLSQNTLLTLLYSDNNNLSSLDVSQNIGLTYLRCHANNLSSLDVSQNTALYYLKCDSNQLESLNVKNGNNINFSFFYVVNNPNLTCIDVDDATWSTTNWTNIDAQTTYSEDCSTMSVDDYSLSGFNIYPNPANELLTISLNNDANYSLINVSGQVFKTGNITHKENTIDVSNLSSGLYFLKVKTDEGVATKKLIKQ